MKNNPPFNPFTSLCVAALITLICVIRPGPLEAAQEQAARRQTRFASPAEATQALIAAVKADDKKTMQDLFGPELQSLLTGDQVQDKSNFQKFSKAVVEACVPVMEGDDKVILNIGAKQWPFPIPLVKRDGQWFFDTDAGKEEIINRHIGRDELYAIGVCRAYVKAQQQYDRQIRDDSGLLHYAMKFKSTPGKQDGLYWVSTGEPSPFDELVAEAHAEGYGNHPQGSGPHPFHGYLFRILTAQGNDAPGGKINYVVAGKLTRGFALVAYPERWAKSGVMTFIVNQDGKVYQRCLDEKTDRIAASMTRYNPGSHWTLVTDQGFAEE